MWQRLLLIVLFGGISLGLVSMGGPALAAPNLGDKTPTATVDPSATETISPTDTPTPMGIYILITPTPNRKPPSLQIPDLEKKIKKGAFTTGGRLAAINPAPSNQTSPIPVEVDQKIDEFWAWLEQRELLYFSTAGKFSQMLPSHVSIIPADGVHQYPDGWYMRPTDQQYSWDDLQAIQYEPIPFAITVDVYHGPEGPGYVACFTMGMNGRLWRRCLVYGANALRKQEWGVVVR